MFFACSFCSLWFGVVQIGSQPAITIYICFDLSILIGIGTEAFLKKIKSL
jgi:hypothetical protein